MRSSRRQARLDELRVRVLQTLASGSRLEELAGPRIELPPLLGVPPVVVTRPADLLRLRFSFEGLRLDTVDGRLVLRRARARTPGRLVVDHAPQHLVEEAGWESEGAIDWPQRPVQVRLSAHSRVVLDVGEELLPWSLEGLLAACSRLPMSLVATAKPERALLRVDLEVGHQVLLGAGRVDDLVVTATNAPAVAVGATTWRRGVRAVTTLRELAADSVVREALTGMTGTGIEVLLEPPLLAELLEHPTPQRPGASQTSLELPWRLQLSPLPTGAWVHATAPVERDGRVELWHSRLGTRQGTTAGAAVREGGAVRAVWSRDLERWPGSATDVSGRTPLPEPPVPGASQDVPDFRKSLSERQRIFLVHETSNFALRSGVARWSPPAVQVDQLALSSLGGWLTSRFATRTLPDGPAGVLAWDHHATMGRDHHVKVVELGFLFPFGHRASLTTITERKLDTSAPGAPAFLVQRQFVSVLEPTRTYAGQRVHLDDRVSPPQPRRLDLVMPFASVTLLDATTPLLDERRADGAGGFVTSETFFPTVGGTSYGFRILAFDRLGHRVEYAGPLLFVGKGANTDHAHVQTVVAAYRARNASPQAVHRLGGQPVGYAPDTWEGQPLDTVLATHELRWDAANLETDGAPAPGSVLDDAPAFAPMLDSASVVVPAVSALSGRAEPLTVRYPPHYAAQGLVDNAARLFLAVDATPSLSFRDSADRSGGFVTPDLAVTGLSGLTGPIGGSLDRAIAGTTTAPDFFALAGGARLFGIVPLADLIGALAPGDLPRFVADQVDRVSALQHDLARLVALGEQLPQRVAELGAQAGAQEQAVAAAAQDVGVRAGAALTALVGYAPGGPFVAEATALAASLGSLAGSVEAATVLPRAVRVDVAGVVRRVAEHVEDLAELVGLLDAVAGGLTLPETVTARLHWSTELAAWPNPGAAVFAPRQGPGQGLDAARTRLDLAVEVQAPTRPGREPTASATCSLSPFSLRLLGSTPFISLDVETIEFAVRAGTKPDVNVVFAGDSPVVFGGPLTWVNVLQDLIPFDGFSDPPYLDVSTAGIKAGFDLALPDLPLGVLNLTQLSLGAEVNVPFVGESLDFRFSFCTRERPFHLTVWVFGGGGFFAITVTPEKCVVLEAAFEFGAAVSLDFGVASGSIEVMAGIYLRLQAGNSLLAGYVRLRGEVDVLGLISASLELYLELGYEPETKTARGRAELTIEVEVLMFSTSVTVEVEKKFQGSDQDPSFGEVMGPAPGLPVAGSPWADYCAAFAAA